MSRLPSTTVTSLSRLSAKILFLLLLLPLATPLPAGEVKGLYEAEVPVEGQSADQRRTAIREAFSQVLVRVTGSREILHDESLRKIQRQASSYVQQYRYRTVEQKAPLEPERLLRVRFDASAVNRMLRNKGLPVWGSVRPSIVIWLSQERRGERVMLQPEMSPKVVMAVETQARQRGLTIMLPLMDMEDLRQLPVSALWGGFAEDIQRASSRYGADVILTGRLVSMAAGRWTVEWSLYQDGAVEHWSGAKGVVSAIVAQGIEQLSDRLARQYTQSATDNSLSQLQITVMGVDDLAGYAKVRQYLESLMMVEQVALRAMNINSGEFLLHVRGGAEALEQGVKLGSVLERVASEPVARADEVEEDKDTVEGPFLPESVESFGITFRLK